MTEPAETFTIPRAEYERLRTDSLELLNRPQLPEEVYEDPHKQLGSCAVCGRTELVWFALAKVSRGHNGRMLILASKVIQCEDCGAVMTPDTYDAVKLMRAELLRQPIRRGGLPL